MFFNFIIIMFAHTNFGTGQLPNWIYLERQTNGQATRTTSFSYFIYFFMINESVKFITRLLVVIINLLKLIRFEKKNNNN